MKKHLNLVYAVLAALLIGTPIAVIAQSSNPPLVMGTQITIQPGVPAATATPTTAPTSAPTATPSPGSNPVYPAAGWEPYTTTSPFTETVASVYGSTPLTSCAFTTTYSGIQGTGCKLSKSDATISNLQSEATTASNGGAGFTRFDVFFGSTNQSQTIFNSGQGNYSQLSNAGAEPGFFSYGTTTGSTPETLVNVENGGCQYNLGGNFSQYSFWLPFGTIPELNTDRHFMTRDTVHQYDVFFILAGNGTTANINANGGFYPIGTTDCGGNDNGAGAITSLTSPTVPGATGHYDYTTSRGLNIAATAGKMSMWWQVRPQDVLAGNIPHALEMQMNCDTSTNGNSSGTYLYPAYGSDNHFYCGTSGSLGQGGSSVNPDYGDHLWQDTVINPNLRGTANCSILAYAVFKALNVYGGYYNDVGGNQGASVNFAADIDDTYDGNPNGKHSYWTDVFTNMKANSGGPSIPNGGRMNWELPMQCGLSWSNFHLLVPPPNIGY